MFKTHTLCSFQYYGDGIINEVSNEHVSYEIVFSKEQFQDMAVGMQLPTQVNSNEKITEKTYGQVRLSMTVFLFFPWTNINTVKNDFCIFKIG